MDKKKYKQVFTNVDAYLKWKAIFKRIKHKAYMDINTGKVYINY